MLATLATAGALVCATAVPGLDLERVEGYAARGAVGLLVPDAGPTTSEFRARVALDRGEVRNSLRGRLPAGPRILRHGCNRADFVVGIPRGGKQPNDRRYLIAAPGAGGLLVSESTRILGLISIADVARGRVRVEPHAGPAAYLRDLDRRIDANGRWRLPAVLAIYLLLGLLALVAPPAAVAAFPAVLLANLALGIAGLSGSWALLLLPAALLPLRRRAAVLGVAAIAAYAAGMAIDATWVALSPLGPSQNGRFYGISNLLGTLMLVPALVGATWLRRRVGWFGFGAVAAMALATVAGSRLGADGGGAAVLAAGYAVLAALLAPARRRIAAAAIAAGALAVVGAVAIVLGPSTHVTESIAGGPTELVRDLGERIELSWLRASANAATGALVGGSLLVLAMLVARGPRRPLPLAFAAAIAVSLLVNDSPREIAVGGLVGYLALSRADQARSAAQSTAP